MKTFNEWLQDRELEEEEFSLETHNLDEMFTKISYGWKESLQTLNDIVAKPETYHKDTVKENKNIILRQILVWREADPEKAKKLLKALEIVIEKLKITKRQMNSDFDMAGRSAVDKNIETGNSEDKFGKFLPVRPKQINREIPTKPTKGFGAFDTR
jgi:hypothetical protein